jgi:transcriptional regulator with XRE-family HTH domain
LTATFLFGNIPGMNIAAHKLATWLKDERVLKGVFAERIGVRAPTVSRLLNGERTPSLELAKRIFEQTDGLVSANDWVTPIDKRQGQTEVAA